MSDAENPDNPEQNDAMEATRRDVSQGDSLGNSVDPQSIEGLFLVALQKKDPAEREAYLDQACGQDPQIRRRVTALLNAYEDAGSFLETPAGGPRPQDEISLNFLKPIEKDGVLGGIGSYEVVEVIGRGGMGIVLRAFEPKLNRVVAVKVLLPELAANANARRRFLREAQAAAAVNHPNVVTIHAVDEATADAAGIQTPPYLVMECVVGQSLQQKLDAVGPLRLAETLRISRQVAEGLASAHKQGLIHRDIKPANILLENGVERVKITDFGLARAIDDLTVTRTGEVSGTPQYMSPEQAGGDRVDHRSDLFSLGCVMYAMCTGHSPFRAESLAHVIKRVTQDTPRSIRKQNPEVPEWLEQIIDCLLQKDASDRIQTAEELVTILDQHLAKIQEPSDSGSHSDVNRQLPKSPQVDSERPATRTHAWSDRHASTRQASLRHFGFLLLLAIAGSIFLAMMMTELGIQDPRKYEERLLVASGMTVGVFLFSWFVMWWKNRGGVSVTRSVLRAAAVLGTFICGMSWTTFVRSGVASSTDFQILSLLTGFWALFCLYAAKRWIEVDSGENQSLEESVHARFGGRLIRIGTFLLVFPFAQILSGAIVRNGDDVIYVGGSLMTFAVLGGLSALLIGYALRHIYDPEQGLHRPLGLATPVIAALLLAFAGRVSQVIWNPEPVRRRGLEAFVPSAFSPDPGVNLFHPEWEIRELLVNGGGSTRTEVSPLETYLTLDPELIGSQVRIDIVLMDGREFSSYVIPVAGTSWPINITDEDLDLRDRALVEVVDDVPGVKLRMVAYPSQKLSANEFTIQEAPFHKALQPGEHRIVLDFVREDWEVPEGFVQFAKLDYRVKVPDAEPIKLSLKEILEQSDGQEQIERIRWNPDFIPLPSNR